MYQEQYTAQEITGYKGSWPSNRRCGHAHWANNAYLPPTKYGTYDGGSTHDSKAPYKPYDVCPSNRYGPTKFISTRGTTREAAVACCSEALGPWEGDWFPVGGNNWAEGTTCPKGWGRALDFYRNDIYSVYNAQGFYKNGGDPIYNTVTKYRDTVYNYTAGRIAKA